MFSTYHTNGLINSRGSEYNTSASPLNLCHNINEVMAEMRQLDTIYRAIHLAVTFDPLYICSAAHNRGLKCII